MEKFTTNQYKLDTSQIESLEDVKVILEAMDLRITERHPQFEKFEPYYEEVEDSLS